ncbi:hypothetical protein G4X40_11955 [Rhodococcus sp. D2-41]|uniref:hypothetical protein n=1 Tax=Speluncibacter jeojiensis TaxID=2710754 RepID=UPI00240FB0D2|nr:hypothetical protein [Rhodococcus sp. D2-41]MDG3010863.1 hypothetical protein [Rhodococcus sp. D2-41]
MMRVLRDIATRARAAAPSPETLRSAYQQAARDGLTAALLDPVTSTSASASLKVSILIAHVRAELEATGELGAVCRAVERLLAGRGGAARQRRQFRRRHDVADVVSHPPPGAGAPARQCRLGSLTTWTKKSSPIHHGLHAA